jgi:hypothetical protein
MTIGKTGSRHITEELFAGKETLLLTANLTLSIGSRSLLIFDSANAGEATISGWRARKRYNAVPDAIVTMMYGMFPTID